VIVNGSGLSLDARLRPSVLTAILADMYHDRDIGPEFAASLAIGGIDGTLWHRFREEDEVSRVRGKTGSINGVHCLGRHPRKRGRVDAWRSRSCSTIWATVHRPARRLEDGLVRGMLHMGKSSRRAPSRVSARTTSTATPAEDEP
jgi:hypothetical protein